MNYCNTFLPKINILQYNYRNILQENNLLQTPDGTTLFYSDSTLCY